MDNKIIKAPNNHIMTEEEVQASQKEFLEFVDEEMPEEPDEFSFEAGKPCNEFLKNDFLNMMNKDRSSEVENIIITLSDKKTVLNGDEISQSRISRAILGLPDDATKINWIGADGKVYKLNKSKLQEALTLAGQAQTEIWIKYAEKKNELKAA